MVAAMAKLPITLCVSTRNAAAELPACLESAAGWVSEIVVVDMESSDDTLAVAESYGAKIVRVPPAGWAEPGRQAGLDAATQPWVLVLDADERAGPRLAEVAASFIEREDVAGVWLAFQHFQFGWWVPDSGIWPDWHLRLFRRERATWPGDRTHVGVQITGHCEHGPADVDCAIAHHSYPSIKAWIEKMNVYTDLEARRLRAEGRRASVARLVALPPARFADLYIRRRGYRGGRYGLTVAALSFCYWLLAELKLWEATLRPSDLPPGSVPLETAAGLPSASAPDAP